MWLVTYRDGLPAYSQICRMQFVLGKDVNGKFYDYLFVIESLVIVMLFNRQHFEINNCLEGNREDY